MQNSGKLRFTIALAHMPVTRRMNISTEPLLSPQTASSSGAKVTF